MRLTEASVTDEEKMLDCHVLPAARDLATLQPDVVVFSCTSAGALRGMPFEQSLCEEIARITKAAVVSTMSAVQERLKTYGARRISVLTPYTVEVNDHIRRYLEDSDLSVVNIVGLGHEDNLHIGRVGPSEIVARVDGMILSGEPLGDALFISCCNFRALEARDRLIERCPVPIVTSNEAALTAALKKLGDGIEEAA
ncbi:MAG: hypothetical protein AB7G08_32580 [Hyphomicrobiaceae bacterium]